MKENVLVTLFNTVRHSSFRPLGLRFHHFARCVFVYVRACVCVCVRACVRVYMYAYEHAFIVSEMCLPYTKSFFVIINQDNQVLDFDHVTPHEQHIFFAKAYQYAKLSILPTSIKRFLNYKLWELR